MNFKRLICSVLLALFAIASFDATAEGVSVNKARTIANSFIKSHSMTAPGSLQAPAMADLVLAHAEPSGKVANTNVYYVFNIKGGGFIIVSAEDKAAPVLGYSDKGQIDINNMSDPLRFMLDGYKEEIDYLLTHKIKPSQSFRQTISDPVTIIEPMTITTWGPEDPYNYQCPQLRGKYSRIGCVGVCMAQITYFWKFPLSCDSLPTYWASRLNAYVPALPATTFDYSKMILSYSHWDFETGKVVLDTYTQEQADEVAKLCRYCGQATQMNYSPTGSTPNVAGGKLKAMIKFGYNSKAKSINRDNYEEDAWETLLQAELHAGRPVMYTGYGAAAASVGHAFIVDGYNNEHYYHMNMGWYGVNDGWYILSAISFVNRFGENIFYERKLSMILGMEPPLFCTINADVHADGGLYMLGQTIYPLASDVDLSMSYRTLPFMFSLTDAAGNKVAESESITLNRLSFENGSDISLPMMLPETLPTGTYDLHLNYRTSDSDPLTQAITAQGQLYVVGRLAKYGTPFGIGDVADAIDMILAETPAEPALNIGDVTMLIDYLLNNN